VLAGRVLAEVRSMMAAVDALIAQQSSHLRVAASFTIAEHLLPGWFGALHAEFPNSVPAMEVSNSDKVLTLVRDGQVDIGFVEGHGGRLDGPTLRFAS
jgi:DNA-binding transcriptional LysR family regulator